MTTTRKVRWSVSAAAAGLGLVLAALLVPTGAVADTSNGGGGGNDDGGLHGQALIDSLGLPVTGGEVEECRNRMSWDDVLYCLDPAATTDAEVSALAERIWGHEPATGDEARFQDLQAQLVDVTAAASAAEAAGDLEQVAALKEQHHALLQELSDLAAELTAAG